MIRYMPEKSRAEVFVSGMVQGVSLRANTARKASQLGLTGWVKNLRDGRVGAVFEGEKERIEEMLTWLKNGPYFAEIKNMEISWQEFQGEFSNFEIRY